MSVTDNVSSRRTVLGFRLAGAYNILGILGFTRFFTDETLATADPVTFSWLGQVSIILWGLAYLAVARRHPQLRALVALFAVEKAVYVGAWAHWLMTHSSTLEALWHSAPVHAAFLATYGLGDLAFGLFFLWVASQRPSAS